MPDHATQLYLLTTLGLRGFPSQLVKVTWSLGSLLGSACQGISLFSHWLQRKHSHWGNADTRALPVASLSRSGLVQGGRIQLDMQVSHTPLARVCSQSRTAWDLRMGTRALCTIYFPARCAALLSPLMFSFRQQQYKGEQGQLTLEIRTILRSCARIGLNGLNSKEPRCSRASGPFLIPPPLSAKAAD